MLPFLAVCIILAVVGAKIYFSLTPIQHAWLKSNPQYAGYPVAILLIVLMLWWSPWSSLSAESPSLKTVWSTTKNYWLWILIACGLAFAAPVISDTKWAKVVAGAAGVILPMLFIVLPFIGWASEDSLPATPKKVTTVERKIIPLKSHPRSMWPKLVIPAGGKSEMIAYPDGIHHVYVWGDKYRAFTVYADGSECSSFGSEKVCHDGPTIGAYVKNESAETNTVIYAFVPN